MSFRIGSSHKTVSQVRSSLISTVKIQARKWEKTAMVQSSLSIPIGNNKNQYWEFI